MSYWDEKIEQELFDLDNQKKHGSIYGLLREMQVGDRLLVPYEMKKSVRPTASLIKSEFGVEYKTTVISTVHGLKYILTRRIK